VKNLPLEKNPHRTQQRQKSPMGDESHCPTSDDETKKFDVNFMKI
jgi:hypothetical protein